MLDLIEDGSTLQEALSLAHGAEKAGATMINTGIGWHEARIPTIATMVPRAAFAWVTEKLKLEIRIPVVATNRINDPGVAEQILAQRQADMVSMARPFSPIPSSCARLQPGAPMKSIRASGATRPVLITYLSAKWQAAWSTRAPVMKPNCSTHQQPQRGASRS